MLLLVLPQSAALAFASICKPACAALLCAACLPALQRQARALVAAFGMDPALPDVLRELWLAFLAYTRLLEPATIR